jgi:hypothetical protein
MTRNGTVPALAGACAITAFWALASGIVMAQAKEKNFALEPVLLDGADATGATVGLQWKLEDNLHSTKFPSNTVAKKEFSVDYRLAGVLTGDKDRNPKNFNDGLLEAKYLYSDVDKPAFMGGVFGKYEADQSFDNRQSVYGLRATVLKLGLLTDTRTDIYSLDANFGRVNPSKDLERQAVLGTTTLDQYYRWDLEFLLIYPLKGRFHNIEFNYRYFREPGAPDAVKTAGLHEHKLYTLRLGLTSELFVAYSKGNLPFDRTSERIFEVGWSHNFTGTP